MSSDGEQCTLKITPVEKRDEGLYMCVISNKAGTTDCEVLLTVERKLNDISILLKKMNMNITQRMLINPSRCS